jgi:hypothetical protein
MYTRRPVTETTTFKCEGCGGRYDAAHLYAPSENARRSLESGNGDDRVYIKGKRSHVVVRACCSKACYDATTPRTVRAWLLTLTQDECSRERLYRYYCLASYGKPRTEVSTAKQGYAIAHREL